MARAGQGGFVDLNTDEVLVAGSPGVGLNLNVQGSLTNIAPRLGIAYQATPKTVVRVGYGRGYDLGVFGSVFGHNVTQNLTVLGISQTLAWIAPVLSDEFLPRSLSICPGRRS